MGVEWIQQKLNVQEVVPRLQVHPDVRWVKHNPNYIKVRFKTTNITESWALTDEAFHSRKIRVHRFPLHGPFFGGNWAERRQFEINPLYPEDVAFLTPHFRIKHSSLSDMGWCSVRLAIHSLAARLVNGGWQGIHYTDPILKADLDHLRTESLDKYQLSMTRFWPRPVRRTPGRRLITHLMPPDPWVLQAWQSYPRLVRAIDDILMRGWDITFESLVKKVGRPLVSPNFYRSIFRQWLDVNGLRVLDAQPDASKAAAVMLSGGEYICRQPDQFRGLAEFLKGKLNIAQPGTYDVMFLNGIRNLATADMKPLIERSLSLAKTLVVCVRSSAQTELAQHFKPKRILRLSNRQGTTAWKDNHIMLIEPK